MQFIVEIKNPLYKGVTGTRTILRAKEYILAYPFGTSERLLDNYLRATFKIGLKEACLSILFNLKKSSSIGTEIIYTILDERMDKMAQLITCGIGDTPGSLILLNAIGETYK